MIAWPTLAVGDVLPPLTRTIELADMIAYAGATWDWHRMHYDPSYLAAKRLAKPVVDGQVFGALLTEAVQDWLGPAAFLRRLDFRFASLVYAGETVRCEGEVTAVEPDGVTVSLCVVVVGEHERRAVTPAEAIVARYR